MSGKIRTRFFVKTVDGLHWKRKLPGRFTLNNVVLLEEHVILIVTQYLARSHRPA